MILERLETYFTAATYAQCGEYETARSIMNTKSSENNRSKGGLRMKQEPVKRQSNKYIVPAIGFGTISISLYAVLLMNESKVTELFTNGGWYAILPVGSAFLFSFIHGAFASNLLSALGIEAKK